MEKAKIDRINFLAKKSRAEGLTDAEKAEQQLLRNEYREAVVGNLRAQLDRIEFVEPDGKVTKPVENS
ncbi:MAG TPA: DUF896 domain-containing protein [Candidatus Faeciplasma pullistercoris]|uniref:UPF0291 protein IAC39_01400 n=1 Tax=Candidatus Faeciplasma pullistercoris TaxID=2840800 RepID=A0A9D1GSQ2_9FIRM|nr:DUF896 domain-containing protein [Candidatus Faeciplasma pullistercoris]